MRRITLGRVADVNKELWLLLSIFLLAALMNWVVAANHMVLGFYTLPTLFSAYFYGRRHAVLTAFASVFVVLLLAHFQRTDFNSALRVGALTGQWAELGAWGGILVVTAYAMGTLYEANRNRVRELKEAYEGVLVILQQFIAKDKYTQHHSYRVSIYASRIGGFLGLSQDRLEDLRAAGLLHDIGKLDISRDVLYKAARLTTEEMDEIKTHVSRGIQMLEPLGGSLRRVIPIVLAHHDKFDGSGYHPTRGEEIPLEARILAVADVYDSLTSDRPYRKAMSPYEAKEIIENNSGKEFDPKVVEGFVLAFRAGALEVPEVVVTSVPVA
jgi:putative nucleotidyltransferase with HDIG domain